MTFIFQLPFISTTTSIELG